MKLIVIMTIFIGCTAMSCSETRQMSNQNGNEVISGEKTNGKQTKITDEAIIGTWQWVKTDCCGRINNTTYAKENEPKRIIEFSKSGVARYFERGEMDKMSQQKFSFGTLGTQTTIKIGEYQPAIYTISENELVISWGYMDLQTEHYKRVQY